jgi:hypothetical protein
MAGINHLEAVVGKVPDGRAIYRRRQGLPLHSKRVPLAAKIAGWAPSPTGSQVVSLTTLLMVVATNVSRRLVGTIAQQAFSGAIHTDGAP